MKDLQMIMFQYTYTPNANGKIVLCYSWNDLIDIYNEEKQLACRIHGPIQFISPLAVDDAFLYCSMVIEC